MLTPIALVGSEQPQILIVDDVAHNRDTLALQLRQIGFRVDTAAEVDGWAQDLARRGFALVAPPSGDRWEGTRSFRVADPDGRQVAVFFDYPS